MKQRNTSDKDSTAAESAIATVDTMEAIASEAADVTVSEEVTTVTAEANEDELASSTMPATLFAMVSTRDLLFPCSFGFGGMMGVVDPRFDP